MIISLGYRVKSKIATNFRRWATERLKEYMIKGFTMDDERLKNLGGSKFRMVQNGGLAAGGKNLFFKPQWMTISFSCENLFFVHSINMAAERNGFIVVAIVNLQY